MKKEQFRIDLSGQHLYHFNELKEINRFEKNVDVFRFALKIAFEEEKIQKITGVNSEYRDIINNYINRDDVRKKFKIFNIEDFTKKAIDNYLDTIMEYTSKRTILNWDIRADLSGDPKDVALAFRECYLESNLSEVKKEELLSKLSWRDEDRLEKILDEFNSQKLIKCDIINNNTVYSC